MNKAALFFLLVIVFSTTSAVGGSRGAIANIQQSSPVIEYDDDETYYGSSKEEKFFEEKDKIGNSISRNGYDSKDRHKTNSDSVKGFRVRSTQGIENVVREESIVQVFLLAGQSNMVGMASLDHMSLLIENTTEYPNQLWHSANTLDHMSLLIENTTEYRNQLWNKSNSAYKVRNDVYVKFLNNSLGQLTLGPNVGFAHPGRFGPEVMFGWTVGDYFNSNTSLKNSSTITEIGSRVLLLKFAYEGVSLAVDFRPPSSGVGNYSGKIPKDYGNKFRKMMSYFRNELKNISNSKILGNGEEKSAESRYKIAGFVWLHGWKDMQNDAMVSEYEKNLINFIGDVRADLNEPQLPFVLGELGQHGVFVIGKDAKRVIRIRQAQKLACAAVANTLFIRTAQYAGAKTKYDQKHHYYGRADTMYAIGQALGNGMVQLLHTAAIIQSIEQHEQKQSQPISTTAPSSVSKEVTTSMPTQSLGAVPTQSKAITWNFDVTDGGERPRTAKKTVKTKDQLLDSFFSKWRVTYHQFTQKVTNALTKWTFNAHRKPNV